MYPVPKQNRVPPPLLLDAAAFEAATLATILASFCRVDPKKKKRKPALAIDGKGPAHHPVGTVAGDDDDDEGVCSPPEAALGRGLGRPESRHGRVSSQFRPAVVWPGWQ